MKVRGISAERNPGRFAYSGRKPLPNMGAPQGNVALGIFANKQTRTKFCKCVRLIIYVYISPYMLFLGT